MRAVKFPWMGWLIIMTVSAYLGYVLFETLITKVSSLAFYGLLSFYVLMMVGYLVAPLLAWRSKAQ